MVGAKKILTLLNPLSLLLSALTGQVGGVNVNSKTLK
jgi:hypothetical protein